MHSNRTCAAAALATLLSACASAPGGMYSEPYALFEPEQRMPAQDTRPAFVMKIDGENVQINRSDPVKPGVRQVEVSIPGPPGMSKPDRDVLTIDAKPCTRYYIAAKRPSMTDTDWKAFVSSVETIGECKKKFEAS